MLLHDPRYPGDDDSEQVGGGQFLPWSVGGEIAAVDHFRIKAPLREKKSKECTWK